MPGCLRAAMPACMAQSVPPMHQPRSDTSSEADAAQRLAHAPRQRIADVVVEARIRVLVVRDAPVEQKDVKALVEQVLHERVPGPQVEDVRAG